MIVLALADTNPLVWPRDTSDPTKHARDAEWMRHPAGTSTEWWAERPCLQMTWPPEQT
jgi:hypothetical protein